MKKHFSDRQDLFPLTNEVSINKSSQTAYVSHFRPVIFVWSRKNDVKTAGGHILP